jgi:MATE family multidrug resistance protein
VNISLNLLFVLGFGWGVEGVALATVIGAWCGLGVGLWRLRARLAALMPEGGRPEPARVLDPGELRQMVTLNRDIFIRTLCLAAGFAWFARLGSQQGDTVLAANGVLMQVVHVSSYALDGFAIAAETLVGQALGARSRRRLRRAVAVTGVAALGLSALLAAAFSLSADTIIALFTNVEAVRETARAYALWATLLPLAGVLAYQLDGVFIGAAEGRRMRNAMILAAGFYLPLGALLAHGLGNTGVWLALWLWMGLRAGFLAASYPGIEARTQP